MDVEGLVERLKRESREVHPYSVALAKAVGEAAEALSRQKAAEDAMAEALKLAICWFDEHCALAADGNDKGQRNQDRADQLRLALTAWNSIGADRD